MNQQVNSSYQGNVLTIRIDGTFDLSKQAAFRQSYEMAPNKPSSYVVDMRTVEYMDSAAFGMLLVLRDYAGGDKANISIINMSSVIKKSFSLLNFDRLFKTSK
ncbi:MAG: STAS domain-containing protein [Gammaproteobacteria bacterium]|nr:STAS domain-containing protein [Gammaproteobacteria bacterium]